MPSLWKKHKGTRFSKLVADLQTPPSKRGGGSLLVETGFPTSIVDLFVKHRDKLKKQKKYKKYKSKKPTTSDIDNDCSNDDQGSSVKGRSRVGISDNYSDYNNTNKSCSDFDEINGPTCPIVRNNDEKKVENVVTTDSSLEDVSSLESSVEFDDNCSKFEVEVEEKKVNHVVVFNSRSYVMLLSILVGALCFGVVLFAKNWFLALITLGVLLLLLLKNCENNAWIKLAKGGLVALLVLNTKCFVVGITLGVCLLILLECVGKSIFGFFKFCRIVRGKLQGILPNWGGSFNKEVGNGAISSRNFVQESPTRNCQCEVGDEIDMKGDRDSVLVEGEKQERPNYELVAQESDDSKGPKSSDCSYLSCIEESEELKLDKQARKAKKNRKFWKKLMSKKKSNKRKKHESYEGNEGECVLNSDCMPDIPPDIEEDEQGVSEGGLSASTRSRSTASLTDGEESGTDKSEGGNVCITEPLHLDNRTNDSSAMVKEGYENMKYVIAVVIPLIGLIRSRVLAIVFTVICCLVIKMAKRLRKTSIEN